MKRAIIIAAILVVAFSALGWLTWPRIVAVLADRTAAKNRQENRLPEDALRALISDPNVTLFSTDPDRGFATSPDVPTFRRWPVLGQTTVNNREQRQQLADALRSGLSRWSGREMVACFDPRHVLRATDGTRTFDFLICFECGWLYFYPPNVKEQQLCIRTKAGPFNDILIAEKIPMSKRPRRE